MREVLIRLGAALVRMTQRFAANRPANPYESIIFSAIRNFASQFGKEATT